MFGEDCIVGEAYGGKETALRERQSRHAEGLRYRFIFGNSKRLMLPKSKEWLAQLALWDTWSSLRGVQYQAFRFLRSEDLRLV